MIDYGFFEHDYPYTNFHELNLNWILRQMIELRSDMRNFVNQNTIKYADPIQWNITTQYEGNTVVIEPISGNAYISSQPVPAGVPISNTDYWSVIGNFSILYESIKASIAAADDGSNINATETRAEGSLLWLNSKLYKVLSDISIGALYITSGTGQNLEEVTIEELLNDETEARKADVIAINSSILNIAGQIGTEGERIGKLETKTSWFVSSFPGDTTADKLQNAINHACENYSGVVVVDIDIDLTGRTILIDKNTFYSDDDYLRLRAKLTIKGINGAKITKGDGGYMFSSPYSGVNDRAGDIAFEDLVFIGNVVLGGSDDMAARELGCSVYNCSKLLRITGINNSYTLVGAVYDNRELHEAGAAMQSVYTFGETCTYSLCYMYLNYAYDIKITSALIENCKWGLAMDVTHTPASINDLSLMSSCIESCPYGAVKFATINTSASCYGIHIENCYFEGNGTEHINISSYGGVRNVSIRGCRFAILDATETCIVMLANSDGNIVENNFVSGTAAGRLIYVTSTNTDEHAVIGCGNFGQIATVTNNRRLFYDLFFNSAFRMYDSVTLAGQGNNANNIAGFNAIRSSASDPLTNVPTNNGILITMKNIGLTTNWVQFYLGANGSMYYRSCIGTSILAWKQITAV